MVSNPQNNLYLKEIELLRVFAVLSLVAFHTLCVYTCEGWGGVTTPMSVLYNKLIGRFIPEANMPLFTFIAGYLMGAQTMSNKYGDLKVFTKRKLQRLMIPYIVIGSIVIIAQGQGMAEWKGMLYGNPNHLWYCLMLFYCYIIFYVLSNYTKEWLNALTGIVSLLLILKYKSMWGIYDDCHLIGGLEIAAYFYFWFWIGAMIYKYREIVCTKSCFASALLLYIFTNARIYPILREMAYHVLLLIVSMWFAQTWNMPEKVKTIISKVSKYSFGIYVFHHVILWDSIHIEVISQYLLPLYEKHDIIMPILMYVVAFGLSYALTDLSLRTKAGRFLLK